MLLQPGNMDMRIGSVIVLMMIGIVSLLLTASGDRAGGCEAGTVGSRGGEYCGG